MDKSILIVGDLLLDNQIYCSCDRLSPEGVFPVLKPQKAENHLGGAANVCLHITSAQIPCLFAYKSYRNNDFANISARITMKGIKPVELHSPHSHSPSKKTRYWVDKHQILRVDEENTTKPDMTTEHLWMQQIKNTIERYNVQVVVFSDYDKGCLTNDIINEVADYCKSNMIYTILDPKRPSFSRLKSLDVIKPNKREVQSTNISANKLSTELGQTYLVNTIGAEGVNVYKDGKEIYSVESKSTDVRDSVSAGDGFAAMLAIGKYKGLSLIQSVDAANLACSYICKNVGSYILSKSEIDDCFLETIRNIENK